MILLSNSPVFNIVEWTLLSIIIEIINKNLYSCPRQNINRTAIVTMFLNKHMHELNNINELVAYQIRL